MFGNARPGPSPKSKIVSVGRVLSNALWWQERRRETGQRREDPAATKHHEDHEENQHDREDGDGRR